MLGPCTIFSENSGGTDHWWRGRFRMGEESLHIWFTENRVQGWVVLQAVISFWSPDRGEKGVSLNGPHKVLASGRSQDALVMAGHTEPSQWEV